MFYVMIKIMTFHENARTNYVRMTMNSGKA